MLNSKEAVIPYLEAIKQRDQEVKAFQDPVFGNHLLRDAEKIGQIFDRIKAKEIPLSEGIGELVTVFCLADRLRLNARNSQK